MLMIENIGKIVGLKLLCGRSITAAGEYDERTHPDHSNYYQFIISKIDDTNSEYDEIQTIVLTKTTGDPYNKADKSKANEYQMFNMGLQSRTFEFLTLSQIKDKYQLVSFMDNVMRKTYEFYKNK